MTAEESITIRRQMQTRDAPAAAWTEKPPAIVRLYAVDLNILLYGQAVGELNVP